MTGPGSVRRVLESIHIFAGLDPEALAALEQACRPFPAKPGETVVREGSTGGELYLIGEGTVEVVKDAGSPRETVLARLEAGDFFGEMCIIECQRRSASVRAVAPATLYALTNGDLLRIFQRWPQQYAILILNIARDLCRRLRAMDTVFAARAF